MLPVAVAREWELLRPLGSGSFAVVWLARHRPTGSLAAIKIILRISIESHSYLTQFTREISFLKQLDHPFISELFDVLEEEHAYYLVMEYCEHGSILNFVNSQGPLEEGRARRYFCQLISALDYLHNVKFIAHRDLKAENVLLDRNDNIRLIDFGLSNAFTKGTPTLMTACGSPAYAAPEMIKGCPYTKAADMWSAGILLYAIVAGKLPFDDQNPQNILQKVVRDEVEYPPGMSRSLVDLLQRLLTKDPNERMTIDRLKGHPWVSQCPHAMLIGFNVMTLSGEGVDRDVIECMTRLGMDCTNLIDQIRRGGFTPLTAIYRLLKRYRLTDRINDFLKAVHTLDANTFRPIMGMSSEATLRVRVLPHDLTSRAPRRLFQSATPQPQGPLPPRRHSRPLATRPPLDAEEPRLTSFELP
jgi:serine/threonine protein kinase